MLYHHTNMQRGQHRVIKRFRAWVIVGAHGDVGHDAGRKIGGGWHGFAPLVAGAVSLFRLGADRNEKPFGGVRFWGHLESGKPVNQSGLCEQVRYDFDSYLRTICVG